MDIKEAYLSKKHKEQGLLIREVLSSSLSLEDKILSVHRLFNEVSTVPVSIETFERIKKSFLWNPSLTLNLVGLYKAFLGVNILPVSEKPKENEITNNFIALMSPDEYFQSFDKRTLGIIQKIIEEQEQRKPDPIRH